MVQSKGAEDKRLVGWEVLSEAAEEVIWRGAVFRLLKTDWPYETPVDFLLVLDYNSPSDFTLVVSTGYKAGHIVVHLPAEAVAAGVCGIDRSWLVANWQRWVYAECPPEAVLVTREYSPGVGGLAAWVPPSRDLLVEDTGRVGE